MRNSNSSLNNGSAQSTNDLEQARDIEINEILKTLASGMRNANMKALNDSNQRPTSPVKMKHSQSSAAISKKTANDAKKKMGVLGFGFSTWMMPNDQKNKDPSDSNQSPSSPQQPLPGAPDVKYYNIFDAPLKNPEKADRYPVVTAGKMSKPNALSESYRESMKLEQQVNKITGGAINANRLEVEGRPHGVLYGDVSNCNKLKK